MTIFVDSSFWIAFRNRRDTLHDTARTLVKQYGSAWVTTNHVRGETWTFLRRKMGHSSAVNFLDALDEATQLTLVTVSPAIEQEALGWLRRHDERVYSFVDATSFAVMRNLRIDRALAFDDDFTAAGFQELRP
jgi:uncharacterized protein